MSRDLTLKPPSGDAPWVFRAGETGVDSKHLALYRGRPSAGGTRVMRIDENGQAQGLRQTVVSKSAAYTVTEEESGTIFIATAADLVFSLPETAVGLTYTFVLAASGLSSGTGLSISPAANDKIMGNGLTGADNKDLILAGSGDKEGDMVTIVGDGADGWYIISAIGTWSIES